MSTYRVMAAFALAAAVAGGAQAQDDPSAKQTPENAQVFLNKVVAQGGSSATIANYEWDRFPPSGNSFRMPDGTRCYDSCPITEASTGPATRAIRFNSVCQTLIDIDIRSKMVGADSWNPRYGYPYGYVIDWTKVAEVRQSGSTVYIDGHTDRNGLKIQSVNLPSENLAKRVAFAMEVIRLSCDPTGSTGF